MRERVARRIHRWQFGVVTLLGFVALCAVFMGWAVHEPGPSIPDLSKQIIEVRVSLLRAAGGPFEMRIKDAKSIESLIIEPLRKSRRDPRPAAYTYLGWTSIHYADGTQDGIAMFLPWGQFKHRDVYGVADLGSLQAATKRSIPNAPRFLFDQPAP